jgi:nicotinamide riboside transporter PnuC
MTGINKRKNLLIFIISTIVAVFIMVMSSHTFSSKGRPPQTWSEIWDDKWLILAIAIVAGIVMTYRYNKIWQEDAKKKQK